MKRHKRQFLGMGYALCGAWSIKNDYGVKWIDWDRTRWAWKDVTCKKCLGLR